VQVESSAYPRDLLTDPFGLPRVPPGGWIYEIKFDGYRALALRGGSETRVVSRNQNDLAKKFTNIRDSIAALNVQDAILDYAASGIINDRVLNIQSSRQHLAKS
jgi:hypothetical protein